MTFYDAAGVRCGEAYSRRKRWRWTNHLRPTLRAFAFAVRRDVAHRSDEPRAASLAKPAHHRANQSAVELVISIDGEAHPIQLDRPLTITLGERRGTIIVRTAQ